MKKAVVGVKFDLGPTARDGVWQPEVLAGPARNTYMSACILNAAAHAGKAPVKDDLETSGGQKTGASTTWKFTIGPPGLVASVRSTDSENGLASNDISTKGGKGASDKRVREFLDTQLFSRVGRIMMEHNKQTVLGYVA